MRRINIHEAITRLSRLVEAAARGEPLVVAKARKPMVKVAPLGPAGVDRSRRFGRLKDANWTAPEGFDKFMQDEIVAMFKGGENWSGRRPVPLLLDIHLFVWAVHRTKRLSGEHTG